MGYLLVAKLVNSASMPRFASSSVEANMAHFENGAYLNVKEGMPFEDFRPPNWERWTEGAVQWGAKELLRLTQPHGRLQMWMLNEENLRWFDQTSQKNMSFSTKIRYKQWRFWRFWRFCVWVNMGSKWYTVLANFWIVASPEQSRLPGFLHSWNFKWQWKLACPRVLVGFAECTNGIFDDIYIYW